MVSRASGTGAADSAKELLARLPLFRGLTPSDLDDVVRHVRTRGYSRGTTIFHKDDPGGLLYVILKGAVSITLPSSEGKDLVLAILSGRRFLRRAFPV